ncbi:MULTISPECIES: hypothetical protein [unclassified Polaromonas]|uniref:hypothetical protein n=1 Tax=unclassified Polaromonas TaxID=2638319 RepID=UPI000F0926CF|nr:MULTISPECIES: hypothetical protein [unclassified Polaromonas]AYQ26838.1 hypothetical protein DT070_01585 [Polaromonas sp. SP1]QGJ18317.1 hypothetical protein F7R28_07860 [Polaromonas sp. Pch-P]
MNKAGKPVWRCLRTAAQIALMAALTVESLWAQTPQTPPPPEEATAAAEPAAADAAMARYGHQPAGVKKMSDARMTCAQIQAETETLQTKLNEQQAQAMATLAAAEDSRQKMLQQTGGGLSSLQSGASTATGLLSMIPGVGMVAGMFGGLSAQATMNSRMAEAQQTTNAMMATQQKAMDAQMAMAATQARHEHLVEMFLAKNCKLQAQP